MIFPLRIFLIVLLVCTQLFAPLLHAHVGQGRSVEQGIFHIPGLEAQANNFSLPRIKASQPLLLVSRYDQSSEGLIVVMGSGLTQNDDEVMDFDVYLPPQPIQIAAIPNRPFFYLSPFYQSILHSQFAWRQHSPRAPPLFYFC